MSNESNQNLTDEQLRSQAKERFNNGVILNSESKFDEAIIEYSKAIEYFEKITVQDDEIVDFLVDAYFHRGIAYYNKGAIYFNKGEYGKAIVEYSEAVKQLERIVDRNDTSVSMIKVYLFSTYNNLGLVYDNNGNYDNAIKSYNEAIKLIPDTDNDDVYYNLGLAYDNKGDYDEAIKNYNIAIGLSPNDDAYYGLGLAYDNKGDYDKAIENYDKAIGHCKAKDKYDSITLIYAYIRRGFARLYDVIKKCKLYFISCNDNRLKINLETQFNKYEGIYDKVLSDFKEAFKLVKEIDIKNTSSYTLRYIKRILNDINNLKCDEDNKINLIEFIEQEYITLLMLQINNNNKVLTKYMSQTTFDAIFDKKEQQKLRNPDNSVLDNNFGKLKIGIASSMNDANEGKTFYNFLIKKNTINNTDDVKNWRDVPTQNKVFIASFSENPGDIIGMWNSQYGDNCEGISYTFSLSRNKPRGSNRPTNRVGEGSEIMDTLTQSDSNVEIGELEYYKVAYYNKLDEADYKFSIFTYNESNKTVELHPILSFIVSLEFDKLNERFSAIYQNIENTNILKNSLILVSHLVKDITYYQENEVRLVNVAQDWNDARIEHFPNHIACFNTGHVMQLDKVTLSPKLTQKPKYKDYYDYVFDGKVEISPSEHPFNF